MLDKHTNKDDEPLQKIHGEDPLGKAIIKQTNHPAANLKQDLGYHPFVENTLSSSDVESMNFDEEKPEGNSLYNMNKRYNYNDISYHSSNLSLESKAKTKKDRKKRQEYQKSSMMGNTKTPTQKTDNMQIDQMFGPDDTNIKNQVTKTIVERLQRKKQ